MKITICIGSSCHLKGSRQIVEQLQFIIAQQNLKDKIELDGAFCMGQCATGVSVTLDGVYHSVQPENVGAFFEDVVAKQLV
jgi:NADH:ubiquinone oxidoreductase subunit E